MDRPPSQPASRPPSIRTLSSKEFGLFKVQLADHLNYDTSLRLATLLGYPNAFIGSLRDNRNVGLLLVNEMERRGDMASDDISTLTDALRDFELDETATKVENIFTEKFGEQSKEQLDVRVGPSNQTTEAVEPINLNDVTIEATDSKAKQQSIIDQLKEAADKGTPIHNLILDTSFRTIDEGGSITLHSGLILPLFSTLTVLSVWTEVGRVMTETELTGFLKYGSKSTQLDVLGFQDCDLPSLSSSTEVLEGIQRKGLKVPWVNTAHCLDTSSGSWEMDTIDEVRADCETGVVMYKHWRKETHELQIKMLQFASENEIPVGMLQLNECYRIASPGGTEITLQSGQTLPALSTVKIISIVTGEGRKIPAYEFANLLEFSNKSRLIEDLSFCRCELPPTLPASGISPEMGSRNFKVSWLCAGHCFDLNLRTWKIADLDTIRMSCGLGVIIYKQCSSQMHKLQVHFLTVASQNNVPIRLINLWDSYRTVDDTTGSIILESGVMLPRLTSLGWLSINAHGRELTEEDVDGLVKYSNHSRQCSEVDFYWCFLPWSVPTDRFPAHLRSGKFVVLWKPENKEGFTLDLASGRWVNHATKMALTEKEYQDMLVRFRLEYK